jgi:hypothetical protein
MGGELYLRILGALELIVMLGVVGIVAVLNGRSTKRRILAIAIACSVLALAAYATRYVPTYQDWVYGALQALFRWVRYGG